MNGGKKFDVVLMNPPYDRDLHLQFLEKTIELADTVVSIQPGGFVNNIGMNLTYKKYADKIIPHLYAKEFLSHRESNDYFKTANGIMSNLLIGVYKHNFNNGKYEFDDQLYNIYQKIRNAKLKNLRNKFIRAENFTKFGVKIFRYHFDPKDKFYNNILCYKGKAKEGIEFDTKNELLNFENSIKNTWVYKFMYFMNDTNPAHLPFLGDYTNPWTNEKLYKLFNITDEERKKIEEIIK